MNPPLYFDGANIEHFFYSANFFTKKMQKMLFFLLFSRKIGFCSRFAASVESLTACFECRECLHTLLSREEEKLTLCRINPQNINVLRSNDVFSLSFPSLLFHLPSSLFHLSSSLFPLSSFIFHLSSLLSLKIPILNKKILPDPNGPSSILYKV